MRTMALECVVGRRREGESLFGTDTQGMFYPYMPGLLGKVVFEGKGACFLFCNRDPAPEMVQKYPSTALALLCDTSREASTRD